MNDDERLDAPSDVAARGPRPRLRVATWNVHGAIGVDFHRSVDRVADVIRALGVDVALLQELDVGRARSGRLDQPAAIALRLGFGHVFGAALVDGEASYGNAIVSRFALEASETLILPSSPGAERRAMTRAIAQTPLGPIELVVTHLGLLVADRAHQVDVMVERLGAPREPRIVGGDLNDGPRAPALERLRGTTLVRAECGATFPAIVPMLRLDHLLVDRRLRVVAVERPGVRAIRAASDHLPVIATLEGERA